MQQQSQQSQQSQHLPKTRISLSLYLKSGAILLLLLLSVLVVACGSNDSNNSTTLGSPAATVTIRIGDTNSSPTPPAPDYFCGAWATDTSPAFNNNMQVNIYAKYVHNVNGNPIGVGGATGTANVLWPDSTITTVTATTTSDGLAVFPVPLKASAINQLVLVTVTFTKQGVPPCTVPASRAAYFTLIVASATATSTAVPSPTATGTGTPTGTPTVTPTGGITPTSTVTPQPTKTPKGAPTP